MGIRGSVRRVGLAAALLASTSTITAVGQPALAATNPCAPQKSHLTLTLVSPPGGDPSLGGTDIGVFPKQVTTHAPDMDNDGHPDVVTQVTGLTTITRGDGVLRIHTTDQPPYSTVSAPTAIDLNGDHHDEVLLPEYNVGSPASGPYGWDDVIPGTTPPGDVNASSFRRINGVIVSDVTGDGLPDLYVPLGSPYDPGPSGFAAGTTALTGEADVIGARADLTGEGRLARIMLGSPDRTTYAPRVILADGTVLPLPVQKPQYTRVVRNLDGRIYISVALAQGGRDVFRVDRTCSAPAGVTSTTRAAAPPASSPALPVLTQPRFTG